MRMVKYLLLVSLIASSGCTIHRSVRPMIAPEEPISAICIEENTKVIDRAFPGIIQDAISRIGVKAGVYSKIPATCEYVVKYVAYQKWDFSKFLSKASIKVYKGDQLVGSVMYEVPHGVFGGGGVNPNKWRSTRYKLEPLLDELFQNLRR